MKIIKNRHKLKELISYNKNLSFVPTMGGLHKGHLSLIKKAKNKTKKVIVSLFVNPKQFNSKKDLFKYPKNIKKDLLILKKINPDYLYLPTFKDLFAFKTKNKIHIDKFEKKLCGKFRPGHFKGVIDAVNRFLEIIKPRYIFLGKKDFQQIYLIKKHIEKNNIKTSIIECKTMRDKNGLAYSTRNENLNKKQLLLASKIIKLIKKEKIFYKKNNKKINLEKLRNKIKKLNIKNIQYLVSLNIKTFKKEINPKKNFNIFIAFYIDKIRLIDNV